MAAVEHLGVADGTVIALEGDPDVIDSQFRLLPPSPDVLTLPALRALTVDAEDQPAGWEGEEDAKAYILMVNEAVAARHAQVAAFIAGRDAGQRRLVLTNGGSARAQVHCINQIASRLTDGDLVAAEIMYQRCTEDGVVGLKNLLPQPSESIPEHLPVVRQSEGPFDLRHGYRSVDASTQANPPRSSVSEVSAGTGLSNGSPVSPLRETRPLATRQSVVSEHDLERAASLQPRSPEGSLPHPAASTLPLSEIDGEDRQPVASIHVTRPSMIRSVSETMRSAHHLTTLSSDEAQHALLHPGGADGALFFPCPPRSPDLQSEFDFSEDEVPYEFGRAKVIQVRGRASRIPLRKTKSMDRVRSKSRVARHRVEVLQSMQAGLSPIKPRLRSKSASAAKHAGATVRAMISNTTQTDELRTRDRHAQTTLSLSTDEQFYVDKGVHVTPEGLLGPPTIQVNELLFEPVIPFQEDYIVQLFDGNEDSLLDDLLERFRRSLNAPSALTIDTIDESPRTPGLESMDAHQNYSLDRDSDDFGQPGSTDSGGSWPTMDEKQPHPTHQLSSASRLHRLHSQKGKMQKNSIGTLSLNSTPPSMVLSPLERVIEIAYSGRYKPLDIQDCFRSVLDQYAPLRTFDPVDSFFGLQSGRLWKSTLSADSSFTRAEGRLDHVVAFGVSEGVSDDLAEITHGRITQLGMKRNGLNRVITVEIRHLLSQVLQRVQNTPEYQSLVYNPRAICELLVPHLEAHLSSEPGARLLVLRYSPETLPMVLNLRHVLSDTVMKVTAIVDPTRAALPGFRQPSTYFADVQSNSISTNHTMNQRSLSTVRGQSEPTAAVVSRSTRSRTRANRSGTGSSSASAAAAALTSKLFAQADFTIGSTAPEPEQDEFLAAIRAVLAQKNSFFEAEPEPKPVVLPAPKPVEVIKYVERIVHVPVPMVGNAASDAIAVAAAVQQHTASAGGGANTPTTAAGPSAYPNRNIGSKNEGSGHGMPSSSGGKHDRAWSFVPSVMPSRRPSNVSMMTTRSRRTTNGNNGPRDPNDPWELWHEDEEEERMLQLLLNPEKPTRRNTNWRNPNKGNPGNSRKALKWLGIIA